MLVSEMEEGLSLLTSQRWVTCFFALAKTRTQRRDFRFGDLRR